MRTTAPFAFRYWAISRRSFGSPIVEANVTTHVLAGPVRAGDSYEEVAEWCEIPVEQVRDACELENRHAA